MQQNLYPDPKFTPVKSRAYVDRLKGHRDTIISLVSPHGEFGHILYSASRDGQIRAWDLLNREIASKLLVSRTENETTVNEDEEQQQTLIKSNILTAGTFHENSVYSAYEDGYICSRNIKSGELNYKFEGHKGSVTGLQFLNRRQLASCSQDGTVRLWDSQGQCEVIFNIGYPVDTMHVVWEGEVDVLYGKNTVVRLDPQRQSIISHDQFPNFTIMSFLVKEKFLILGTIDNQIHIYDLSGPALQETKVIKGGQGWALCMMIHRSEVQQGHQKAVKEYLFVGTDDRKIKVFDTKSWDLKEELVGHADGITTLTVANKMLYSGSFDHFIRSWSIEEMHDRIRERAEMAREDLYV